MDGEGGNWLTYVEAGHRLNVSPDAVRAKALRKRWRRQIGNDGKARVWIPADERPPDQRQIITQSSGERENDREPDHRPIIARSSAGHQAIVAALESHIKTLQADNEGLKEQLATERSAFAVREAALASDLAAEKARTDRAIAAFAALAERLDALAAARTRRSWWRRLAG
jgi:hypothetical protein